MSNHYHLTIETVEGNIEFVQQGIRSPGVWQQLKGQVFLGGDEFVDAMSKRLEVDAKFASQEIPRAQRRALEIACLLLPRRI